MNPFKKTLFVLLGLCTILLSISVPLRAQLPQSLSPSPVMIAQQPNDPIYEQAKAQLPEDFYMLYRVVERLSRANGLDNLPWRVDVAQEYSVNAFAADYNLLAFYTGLLDTMHGDSSAIAFVVGHEMGHHTRNHIAVGSAEKLKILSQLRQEAIDEVASEEEDLRDDLEENGAGQWAAAGSGTLLDSFANTGGLGGLVGGVLGRILEGDRQQRLKEAAERIDAINAQKQAEVEQQWQELSHRQEFEADESGYQYMARAGFDIQGAFTALELLNRSIGSQLGSDTHPAIPDRIAKITALKTQYPSASLVSEGKAKLAANPQPLTYDASRDGSSLRINSKVGSRGSFDGSFPR